jgi:hypothetical protein
MLEAEILERIDRCFRELQAIRDSVAAATVSISIPNSTGDAGKLGT